jgi:RNA polymerase sigma-70 factor (ECF subfamily)
MIRLTGCSGAIIRPLYFYLSPRGVPELTPSSESITKLLVEWREGDQTALDRLIPLVHQELHRLAHHYLKRERPGHTLQTTALVNEAYLKLVDHKGMRWQNRSHFFAVAAQAMRRILVDHARTRDAAKRGGGIAIAPLDEAAAVADTQAAHLLALNDALDQLATMDERKARIVVLRYFGGMSVEETAEVVGVSAATVMREWSSAKTWLFKAMSSQP